MRDKRKAPAGARGGGQMTAGSLKSTSNYNSDSPILQAPFNRHYSTLLDQALARMERHTRLARFHYRQASLHREMKSYLERYIFGGES